MRHACPEGMYLNATEGTDQSALGFLQITDAGRRCVAKTPACPTGQFLTLTNRTADDTCAPCATGRYKVGLNSATACAKVRSK